MDRRNFIKAGVIGDTIDWKASFDTSFAGKGVGMDLKK